MNIEKEIFKRTSVDFKKLEPYGFKKEKNKYIFEKKFLKNNFKAIITISDKGIISGKVIDLQVNEEYTNINTKMTGDFINTVRNLYKNILIDIKINCFETKYFIFNQSNRINKYIKDKYNVNPEFLWDKFPGYAVYRNSNNKKWYGIIMNIDLSKLEDGKGEVEILNVKLDENKIKNLLKQRGFYKAYHMNKTDWISIILNDTIKDEYITELLDESHELVNQSK